MYKPQYVFQMEASDIIWLELNSNFDLNLYVINPGDEIFVPAFLFPNYPAQQSLRKTLEWKQIKLTKESTRMEKETCNDASGYVFGGKIISNIISKH